MDKVGKILSDRNFLDYVKKNKSFEKGREFCKHNLAHFLDVARIAYIINLEEKFGIKKEVIYAAALLHDVGRWKQYQDGTPHNESGAELAKPILQKSGFSVADTELICEAILSHRKPVTKERKDLAGLLFRADKISRICTFCKMNDQCDWEHKNGEITI